MIIESEGGGLCWKSRRRTFTDTVLQHSDNRLMSALHGGPVLCNPQILHNRNSSWEDQIGSLPRKPEVEEFLSHPRDATIDSQAAITGLLDIINSGDKYPPSTQTSVQDI